MVRLLVEHGADIEKRDRVRQLTDSSKRISMLFLVRLLQMFSAAFLFVDSREQSFGSCQ